MAKSPLDLVKEWEQQDEYEYQDAIKNVNVPLLLEKVKGLKAVAPLRVIDDGSIGINMLTTDHLARLFDENDIQYRVSSSKTGKGQTITHIKPRKRGK